MKDGLYQVTTHYACFGFVVRDGIITRAAHMLKGKRINYYVSIAKWVCE